MSLLHLCSHTSCHYCSSVSIYCVDAQNQVQMRDINFNIENAIAYVVYDLSIFPIEERRRQAINFRSGKCVCNFMGYPPNKITDLRQIGRKVVSRNDGKTYAVRIKKKEVNVQ